MFGSMLVGTLRAADAAPAAYGVIVTVIVKAKPGLGAALHELLIAARRLALVPDNGCSMYNIHVCTKDTGRFALYEQWDSNVHHARFQAQLAAHGLLQSFIEVIAERATVFAEAASRTTDATPEPF